MANQIELGGLQCVIEGEDVDSKGSAKLNVVLCHGFGAPGTDLVPIGGEIFKAFPEMAKTVRFIFPAAPLSLDEMGIPGGRAWWPLDMVKLQRAVEFGETRNLRNDSPSELPNSRDRLVALLGELEERSGLPIEKTLVGGFSQGSMLATDVSLRLPTPPAGLIIWSGTLLCEDEWKELAEKRTALPIFQSHGRQDQILPFEAAEWLKEMFESNNLDIEFHAFNGPHTIPVESIHGLLRMIDRANSTE